MNIFKNAALAAAVLLAALPSSAQIRGFHQAPLKDWEFSKDGSKWTTVTLPHCYNADDSQSKDYFRGEVTYRREIDIKNDKVDHYLCFEGAAQSCKVRINGDVVASHKGGYTPFSVKINEGLKLGTNTVEVTCSNLPNPSMVPLNPDFNLYGGLHGQVWLLDMEDLYLSPVEYGQYRLRVETPEVSEAKVTTNVRTMIKNPTRTETKILVRVQLLEPDGYLAYQADREIFVKAYSEYDFNHDFFLKGLHFWDGVNDPYLYTVRVEIFKGKRMLDIADTRIGYRYFEMDPEDGLRLNGKPYPLYGVGLRQDFAGKALAADESDYRQDLALVKELGANFVRMEDCPVGDSAYQLCDSLGLIVESDIPWTKVCGMNAKQSYFNNVNHQMGEMVSALYNHPSVLFWGMWDGLSENGNTDEFQGSLDPDAVVGQTADLYDFVKETDPCRLAGVTDPSGLPVKAQQGLKSDWKSLSVRNLSEMQPDGVADAIKAARAASGFVELSSLADAPGQESTGLVSYDRQTRKDAFYLCKSLWNKNETTVRIAGGHPSFRASGKDAVIRVYSNAKSLTLYQNGSQVARKTSSGEPTGVIWTFPATKVKGDSATFKVVADNGVSDEVTVTRGK